MKYEEFKYCIDNHINILSKILKHELIIPNFNSFTDRIKTIYELTKKNNVGNVASYIPQLKPINYGIALEELGEENVHKYVGREPSGQAFNELTLNKDGKPHNPLINSGAIMTSALIKNQSPLAERF